jgi:SAM-dependent methyltransferase
MTDCRICGNQTANTRHVARELHLGLGDEFNYFECGGCGCLQIESIPRDLSKYYPNYYYSYQPAQPTLDFSRPRFGGYKQRLVLKLLNNYYFGKKNALGRWLARRSSLSRDFPLWVRQQRLDLRLSPDSKILDVGCGKGRVLLDLRALGFKQLAGIDPFLDADVCYDNGVKVYRRSVDQLDGQFDFIMLNHSFEHMPDQLPTLEKLRAVLKPNRYLMIRIPVVDSDQWRRYGLNWVGLDAPRHFYLHTRKSMERLARQAGFSVAEVGYDADGFSDWASEQYAAGVSLIDPRSYGVDPGASMFKPADIDRFAARAAELNARGEADCAVFYLRADDSRGDNH